MFIYIDESGVHKQDGQSSVALVYIAIDNADELNNAVCDLESSLEIQGFHWSKYNWKIRYKFFQGLQKQKFTVKAIILQNPFSEEIFEMAIRKLLTEKKVKHVIIDGKKSIRFVLRLKKVLRENHISAEKILMGNDMAFPGLRVADAFAGLVRSSVDKDNLKAQTLYKLVENKITTLAGGPVSS